MDDEHHPETHTVPYDNKEVDEEVTHGDAHDDARSSHTVLSIVNFPEIVPLGRGHAHYEPRDNDKTVKCAVDSAAPVCAIIKR